VEGLSKRAQFLDSSLGSGVAVLTAFFDRVTFAAHQAAVDQLASGRAGGFHFREIWRASRSLCFVFGVRGDDGVFVLFASRVASGRRYGGQLFQAVELRFDVGVANEILAGGQDRENLCFPRRVLRSVASVDARFQVAELCAIFVPFRLGHVGYGERAAALRRLFVPLFHFWRDATEFFSVLLLLETLARTAGLERLHIRHTVTGTVAMSIAFFAFQNVSERRARDGQQYEQTEFHDLTESTV